MSENRKIELRKYLESCFPKEYWEEFSKEFGHNFFNQHIERTLQYDELIGEKISHKTVLEVGGFPGLETAWLKELGCDITTIDSPEYYPLYYSEWCMENEVVNMLHDIVDGAPAKPIPAIRQVAIMSDVMLHIEGFPIDFMKWLCGIAEDIYVINYPGDARIANAKGHNLKEGFTSIPSDDNLKEFMELHGAKFVETIIVPQGNRHINVFKGK